MRGTRTYPNLSAIQRRLASLYDAHLSGHTGKRGEAQVITFSASVLNADCIPDGTDAFGELLKVFEEALFEPVTENGCFIADYVESEKRNLTDAIRAKINNKNAYAVSRCFEEMCAGEKYGVPDTGRIEDVEGITPEALYHRYLTVLKTAAVEIFYVGNGRPEQIVPRLREMFRERPRGAVVSSPTEVIRTPMADVRIVTGGAACPSGQADAGFRTGSVLSDGGLFYLFAVQ